MTRPFENYSLESLRAERDEIDAEIAHREKETAKLKEQGAVTDRVLRAQRVCDKFLTSPAVWDYELLDDGFIGLFAHYATGPNDEDFRWYELVLKVDEEPLG